MKITDRKIVLVNQAANYLTIGLCNEFAKRFEHVALVTGGIHVQGEELNEGVPIQLINRWRERHGMTKVAVYIAALMHIFVLLRFKFRRHEVLFVSVPPMAYLLNLLVPNRCSMIIWDVYPDIFKITGMKETHLLYRFWARLNRHSFRRAFRLFTIGEKIAETIAQYVPREKIIVQPIWSIFQKNERVHKHENPFVQEHGLQDKFIVQYSGNIGLTHRVEVVVTLAEKLRNCPGILFQIIGRGPREPELRKVVAERGLDNCMFLPFQPDDMFPYSLSAADVGVVILDEMTAKGSVPSKSYNLMSFGIPSLYIASPESELSSYANRYGHAACFSEEELDRAVDFIVELSRNEAVFERMSQNSIAAAGDFKRNNAARFVDFYLQPNYSET